MRQGQQNKRMHGRSRKVSNPLNRVYESNGPDVKVRGTANHVAEKYLALARDAQVSGDLVSSENYLQHAEHYFRIIAAAQSQSQPQQRPAPGSYNDDNDGDGEMNGTEAGISPRDGQDDTADSESDGEDEAAAPQPASQARGGRRRRPALARNDDGATAQAGRDNIRQDAQDNQPSKEGGGSAEDAAEAGDGGEKTQTVA